MTEFLCAPVMIERACGGWLAVAPDTAVLRIGTTGATKEEAANRFADALRQCRLADEEGLHERDLRNKAAR
jgi:hypothetical protein